ncbi:hypothetical protein ACE4Z7_24550, partial [Salmonella enterica]|uniref:hypothetical protein n=1 Tax=Salmonella enterica TaxID=28901 RepID=UPI003D2DE996
QLGFADEYQYSNACEADIYCDSSNGDFKSPSGYGALPGTSFNVAAFNAKSNYASSAEARKAHASRIPWLSQIPSSTELIHGHQLGTSPLKG